MKMPHAIPNRRLVALLGLMSIAPLAVAQLAPSSAVVPATAPAAPATASVKPVANDATSYSVGLNYGHQLYTNGLGHGLSIDALQRGLKEGLAGKAMSAQDQTNSTQLLRQGREWMADRNRAAAKEFLAKNAAASGVMTTASGLQYQVFAAGDSKSASPGAEDRVTARYVARLLDGTEFDNSESHGSQPPTFSLNGVIKGWHEALTMMKPGAKWRVFIPPALAFDSNSPATVPPGSLIIADLELIKVDAAAVVRRMEIDTPPSTAAK